MFENKFLKDIQISSFLQLGMEFLQVPKSTIERLSDEGLELLPALRDRFSPMFFPNQSKLPLFSWDEILTGYYCKNIPNQDREIRVSYKINHLQKFKIPFKIHKAVFERVLCQPHKLKNDFKIFTPTEKAENLTFFQQQVERIKTHLFRQVYDSGYRFFPELRRFVHQSYLIN